MVDYEHPNDKVDLLNGQFSLSGGRLVIYQWMWNIRINIYINMTSPVVEQKYIDVMVVKGLNSSILWVFFHFLLFF